MSYISNITVDKINYELKDAEARNSIESLNTEIAKKIDADNLADVAKSGEFSDLNNIPTTLAGYGITDAATSNQGAKADNAIHTIQIGGNIQTKTNGVVNLPAYPTTLPASDVKSWAKADNKPSYTASEVGALASTVTHLSGDIATSEKGAANGVATLGSDGKVPSTQLPSYVDDVLEYTDKSKFPTKGETGKIYVDTTTNITYRWSGSVYTEISSSLALGETSSTAYRGDKGKTAYDHSQSTHARTDATKVEKSSTNGNIKINGTETTVYTHPSGTNPHGTTKSDVGLGNVDNTSDIDKPVSTAQQEKFDEINSNLDTLKFGEVAGGENLFVAKYDGYYSSDGKINNSGIIGSTYECSDIIKFNGSNIYISTDKAYPSLEDGKGAWVGIDCFDSNKNFISGSYLGMYMGSALKHKFPLPSGVCYVGMSSMKGVNVCFSEKEIDYTPYIPSVKILAKQNDSLSNKTKLTLELGAIRWADGSNVDSTTWKRSGFVKVTPNTKYTLNRTQTENMNIVGYKEDKTVITDGINSTSSIAQVIKTSEYEFTTTPTTNYIRIAIVDTNLSENITITNNGIGNTVVELVEDVSALKNDLSEKAPSNHTHNYAGSSSVGGSANSAVKLDSSAGSATQPVYFSGGKPVACSYTLGKSVPSNAVFTDTWRSITTSLTSTSNDISLAASAGKSLQDQINKLNKMYLGTYWHKCATMQYGGNLKSIEVAYNPSSGIYTFITVSDNGYIYQSSSGGKNWSVVYNSSSTMAFNDVVYANGKFVVCGNSGVILYSSDGTKWRQAAAGTGNLYKIAYGNGIYMVCGNGTCYYSTDGITWTKGGNFGFGTPTTVLAYGFDYFVAAGIAGWCCRSSDGITWTSMPSFNNGDPTGLVFLKDRFIAVSNKQAYFKKDVLSSENWNTTFSSFPSNVCGLGCNTSNAVIALGANGCISHSNGGGYFIKERVNDGSITFYSVAFGSDRAIAVGSQGSVYISHGNPGENSISNTINSIMRSLSMG